MQILCLVLRYIPTSPPPQIPPPTQLLAMSALLAVGDQSGASICQVAPQLLRKLVECAEDAVREWSWKDRVRFFYFIFPVFVFLALFPI